MANEVNTQRSKLMGDMLHIEFLNGNSYLYSLQEIADIIAAQQPLALDLAMPPAKDDTYKIEWLDSETVRLTPRQ